MAFLYSLKWRELNDEGGIKSASRGTAARAESESIEAPSRYLYLFGGLSPRSPFGSKISRFGAKSAVKNIRFFAKISDI